MVIHEMKEKEFFTAIYFALICIFSDDFIHTKPSIIAFIAVNCAIQFSTRTIKKDLHFTFKDRFFLQHSSQDDYDQFKKDAQLAALSLWTLIKRQCEDTPKFPLLHRIFMLPKFHSVSNFKLKQ